MQPEAVAQFIKAMTEAANTRSGTVSADRARQQAERTSIARKLEGLWDVTRLDLSRICAARSARLGHLTFEGHGAFASQCGMPTARVIETVDVLEDGCLSLSACFPRPAPDQLGLDGLEEGLDGGIVMAVIRL